MALRDEPPLTTEDLAADPRRQTKQPIADRPSPEAGEEGKTPLFPRGEAEELRSRWENIQTGFVDDPRHAVQQADSLVAQTMKRLAEIFSEERNNLEGQWGRGDNVSTEDLRIAMQRYRSFFDRLLSM